MAKISLDLKPDLLIDMNVLYQLFASKRSELHQSYFDKLPRMTQEVLASKPMKDQEKLLETFSKQSEDRIQLLCTILEQQSHSVLDKLFTKEIRLLNALIKVDTCYLEDVVSKPSYLSDALEKKESA